MTRIDPRNAIRHLYGDRWGYEVSYDEEQRIQATQGSSTYGEIMPTALDQLIDALDMEDDDVFFDLGSGMGKVVLQVAMTCQLRRCVGIELVDSRHEVACEALASAREQGLLKTEDVVFQHADLQRAKLSDATVIYTCSTAFSDAFMEKLVRRLARLPEGIRLASLLELDENPWFEIDDVLRLDVSWRRKAKMHVYRLARPLR
ncbi:MAG: hypothetical protein JKY37_26430 [Nannocystaceae bacterium]|nr:hypothetical protein [Nannocystaceae bacterium]